MIPRRIHQIWIGPRPVPDAYAAWSETWKARHPGWQHTLWREADLPPVINRYAFDKIAEMVPEPLCYGIQADLLRYELLARFGGLYVDLDLECLKPVDELLEDQAFVVAMEPVFSDRVPNDFMAARAGHPLLWELIVGLEDHVRQLDLQASLGNSSVQPLEIAGPMYLKRALERRRRDDVTVLPYQLIHPHRRWLEGARDYEGAAYVRNHMLLESGMWR